MPTDALTEASNGRVLVKVFCFLAATILLVPALLGLHQWIETTSEDSMSAAHPLLRSVRVHVRAFWTASIDIRTPNATDCLRLVTPPSSLPSSLCLCNTDDDIGSRLDISVPFVWTHTVDLVAWPCSNKHALGYGWEIHHRARWLSILLMIVLLAMLTLTACAIARPCATCCRRRICCRQKNKTVSVYTILPEADDVEMP